MESLKSEQQTNAKDLTTLDLPRFSSFRHVGDSNQSAFSSSFCPGTEDKKQV